MKQLLLIRHGQPHEGHAQWPGDPPLNEQGLGHARLLARRLASEGIDRIYSSTQRRAADTAQPLAEILGLDVTALDGLCEVDRGAARYRSVDTLKRELPTRWEDFIESPCRFFGRDPAAYAAEVRDACEQILADPCGTKVAVFSHGMAIKTALSVVLGLNELKYSRFSIEHCSVTRLTGSSLPLLRIDSINERLCEPTP
jgi:broad specificity phosphatase PhoE